MSWELTVATVVGCLAGGVSAAVALVAWRHTTERAALSFLGLMVTLSRWSLLYGINQGYGTFGAQLV